MPAAGDTHPTNGSFPHKQFLRTLLGIAFLFSQAAQAAEVCVAFPRDTQSDSTKIPAVEVCTTEEVYRFRIVDRTTVFQKHEFESRLNQAVFRWLEEHNLNQNLVSSSNVYIWLSVPEANPAAAQPRALVDTQKGYLSFWFDLNADEWILTDQETAVLGSSKYPQSFGHRPQVVLAKAQNEANYAEVVMALTAVGASEVTDLGSGWYSAKTKLFEEKFVAVNAVKFHGQHIRSAQANSVVEWIADRQMVFAFSVDSK